MLLRSMITAFVGLMLLTTVPVAMGQSTGDAIASEIQDTITPRRVIRLSFDDQPKVILPKLLTRVDAFDPAIETVTFDHSGSETPGEMGVGSRRICTFTDGRTLVEPILVWNPPSRYAYGVDPEASTMDLPVSRIALIYDFALNEYGGSDVTVRAHFDPLRPEMGALVVPVLTGTLRRTFQSAVDVFGGTYLGDEKL